MRWQTLLLAALLSVAACTGSGESATTVRPLGDPEAPAATTALPPSTTAAPMTAAPSTTTTEPDPWPVPAEPDAAYLERVLNELERGLTVAARRALSVGEVDSEVMDAIRNVSTGINYEFNVQGLEALMGAEEQLLTLERAPRIADADLLVARETCAVVEATVFYDGVYAGARQPDRVVFEIVRSASGNATGWLVSERHVVGSASEELCDI